MNSTTTGAILAVAVSAFCADAGAVESDRDHAAPAAGSTTSEEAAGSKHTFEAPGSPPDGTGVVSVERVARGSRDGEPGTYYIFYVFDYIESVLVNVESRVHFVPDARGAERSAAADR